LIEILLREGICILDESLNIDEALKKKYKSLEMEAKSKGIGIWNYDSIKNVEDSRSDEL
jgi:endonuclease YncB( thermonuclease family)